jgi:hypothetical protein
MFNQSKNIKESSHQPQLQSTNSFFSAGSSVGLMLFPSLDNRCEKAYLDQVNETLVRQHEDFLQRRREIDNFLNVTEQTAANTKSKTK